MFKSLDLGFLILFLLKASLPLVLLQQRLRTRQQFMYPCRFIFYLVTHTQCIFTQHEGFWSSRMWEKCFPVCLQTGAVRWHPFMIGGGRGGAHTYSTSTHVHTGARTHAHTQTATQFNILPLQTLSINKQLENNNNNKSKLCLRTHWMRWLVVLLSKHTQEDPQLHASSSHDYYTYIHTIRIIKPFLTVTSEAYS